MYMFSTCICIFIVGILFIIAKELDPRMMYLYFFCICCVLQPLVNIFSVSAKRKPLQRFLLEEGAKQPIFGSYNYDPIRQLFDISPDENNTQQGYNGSYIYTTAYPDHEGIMEAGDNGSLTSQRYFIFRKNVDTTLKASLRKTNDINNATSESKVAENVVSKKVETNEVVQQQTKPNNMAGVFK